MDFIDLEEASKYGVIYDGGAALNHSFFALYQTPKINIYHKAESKQYRNDLGEAKVDLHGLY